MITNHTEIFQWQLSYLGNQTGMLHSLSSLHYAHNSGLDFVLSVFVNLVSRLFALRFRLAFSGDRLDFNAMQFRGEGVVDGEQMAWLWDIKKKLNRIPANIILHQLPISLVLGFLIKILWVALPIARDWRARVKSLAGMSVSFDISS